MITTSTGKLIVKALKRFDAAGGKPPLSPASGSPAPQCRYIISGSEGQCQERATHVITTPQNKYPAEFCAIHAALFTGPMFKVTKLENEKADRSQP